MNRFEKNWQQIGFRVGAFIFIGAIIGWLVYLNWGNSEETNGQSGTGEDRKGAITSGLIDGKDYGTDYTEQEETEFEVLVVLRDQQASNPEEDRRVALKRGDVIAVRKLPHLWSDTERVSYLIVKIKMTGKEANALLEPKLDGDKILIARAKEIDLDQIGFMGNQVVSGQPLEGKVFNTDIIKTK